MQSTSWEDDPVVALDESALADHARAVAGAVRVRGEIHRHDARSDRISVSNAGTGVLNPRHLAGSVTAARSSGAAVVGGVGGGDLTERA